jgi:hypothetical protein
MARRFWTSVPASRNAGAARRSRHPIGHLCLAKHFALAARVSHEQQVGHSSQSMLV